MKTPSFLARTPIDSPNRSGFHIPYENMFTGRTGTLYPVFVKECIPNETHSLNMMFEAELPPMASNFFGRVDLVFEAFFVPYNLLWAGWEYFAMHPTSNPVYPSGSDVAIKPRVIPHITLDRSQVSTYAGVGSLSDFLGFKMTDNYGSLPERNISLNSLPFLAYHRIYDDWYRNSIVQAPLFFPARTSSQGSNLNGAQHAPFTSLVSLSDDGSVYDFSPTPSLGVTLSTGLGDGLSLTDLRQRNWNLDYFTAATPQPQAGGASSITFDVVGTADDDGNVSGAGSVTVAAIRQANAIQKWMERNNLVGYDYADQVYAQYGVYPDNRLLRKPIYLGRYVEPVYNRSVYQTTVSQDVGDVSKNPFSSPGEGVGTKFGSSQSNGKGQLFSNFKSTDHGFLMVMCSLRPHAYYATGMNRMLSRRTIGDVPFPLLSGVGDQAIYNRELLGDSVYADEVFGYIDQYADAKTAVDEVHGLVRDGEPLDAFVLQRSFDASEPVQISSNFLRIPQDYLDQVKQVTNLPVDFWASCFFDYRKTSPLPVYSVPTLGDLKNAHTEYVRRGGMRL